MRTLLTSLLTVASLYGETVKDREGAVRADKARMENDARWIYGDVSAGFAEAKRTGRPLLVALRCIPCLSCMGLDSAVLQEKDLAPLLDQFVCVRVINANALDLSLFQMDTDLSFSTLFFNADGTVYARYGSWTHQKNSADEDTASYRLALEGVLKLHSKWPANREMLKGKQPTPAPFKQAADLPSLAEKYKTVLDWEGKVVGSCIHCHMIGDAWRTWHRDARKPMPDEWLYPFPSPQTVGVTLAADLATTVASVIPDTPAAAAGLHQGDVLQSLDQQPLVSAADVTWVLHRATKEANIPMQFLRQGKVHSAQLHLQDGWREQTDNTQRVGIWPMRGMATGGLLLVDLADDERAKHQIHSKGMALRVKSVGQYGKHAAAKRAGFHRDDILTEVDGLSHRLTESQLHAHLLRHRFPGEDVRVKVLRGSETLMLQLPMQ